MSKNQTYSNEDQAPRTLSGHVCTIVAHFANGCSAPKPSCPCTALALACNTWLQRLWWQWVGCAGGKRRLCVA